MLGKRKQYLYDSTVPLTKYALTKIGKASRGENCLENDLAADNLHQIDITCEDYYDASTFAEEYQFPHDATIPRQSESETTIEHCRTVLTPQRAVNVGQQSFNILRANETSLSLHLSEVECAVNEDIAETELYSSDEEQELFDTLGKKKKSCSLEELKTEDEFFKTIATTVDHKPCELLLLALKYSLKNNFTFSAMVGLLKMINLICGKQILPETRYRMDQLLNQNDNVVLHSVCPTCSEYIGRFQDLQNSVKCDQCKTIIDVCNQSCSCFFAIIDPSSAVSDYIQTYEDYYEYIVKERSHKKNEIKDIYDGKLYRKFVKNLPACDRHSFVTAILNTDGAPVFESSRFSIWPIYIMLNELPIQDRLKNIIVVGLWFGESKPEMSVFLQVFVKEMNKINATGIQCTIKKQERLMKLFILTSCVDTVARAPMNGSVQFNGYYGCDWCLNPGQYVAGSMRYPFMNPPPIDRDQSSTITFAKEALTRNTPIFGIKYASPLLNLKYFDIISSFTPDYMHCVLAGVASQFTEYFLNSMSKDDVYELDELLIKIKVPNQLCRLTRPLKERNNWKAREWENWLLFYSLPVLSIKLKTKLLKHWSLLVEALYICLQMNISYVELNHAHDLLTKFVSQSENLYSVNVMTYNLHQLLHLIKSIYDWGPLWAHSTFPFESANHNLLRAIKCSKGVILQIVRYLNFHRSVQILQQIVYPRCSHSILEYYENIVKPQNKKIFKFLNITYIGKEQILDTIMIDKFNVPKNTKVFLKMIMNGCLFMSSKKVNKRSCNYFAQLRNGQFIKIIYFLVDIDNNIEFTTCQSIAVRSFKYTNVIKEILHISDEIMLVKTIEIFRLCVYINVRMKNYIIPQANTLYY